jgi:flagellar biosynthesis/type III secretory pathway chaperone
LFEATASKEALVHWISQAEDRRRLVVHQMVQRSEVPAEAQSLKEIIAQFQVSQAQFSEQLQIDLSALMVLVERIQKQNASNGKLLETSIKHVDVMRKNIFGEAQVENKTYNKDGHKSQPQPGSSGPRMISREV